MKYLFFILFIIVPIINWGQYKLDNFEDTPEEIDGCSCYFSFSKQEFETKEYFYFNNFGNLSFIKLNGQVLELTLSNDPEENDFNYYEYKNHDLLMKIWKDESIPSSDEVALEIGSYQIFKNNKLILSGNFYGECGC